MLGGLRVLDLTFYLPGPYATWLLAELGAEVVKVESPAGGDPLRWLGPAGSSPAGSVFFEAVNRGKKSLTLDLKAPEGRELFLRLAAGADAVVEQFRPGVAERLGLGYEALRAVNPRLVYVSLTGYGQSGPLAREAGHDINYLAWSGLLDLFLGETPGAPDRSGPPPRLPPIQLADLNGGSLAAIAVLAGVLGARLTGRGTHLDVSMTDGALGLLVLTASAYLAGTGPAPAAGNLVLAGAEPFYGVYRCADGGRLAVGALEPRFWSRVLEVLAEADPERRPVEVIGASREEVARVFAARPAAFWLERFAATPDSCVSPVLTVAEALDHPNAVARGMVAAGHIACPLAEVGPGGEPQRPAPRPAPRLGEHNRELLLGLGLAEEEVQALGQRGVILPG
ncbi:MAG: CoA transferase [Firmicutes bacterium]|nr:CoA transferase [Bacillota bacterium]